MGWHWGVFSSAGAVWGLWALLTSPLPEGAGGPDEHHRGERGSGCRWHHPLGQPGLQHLQGECRGWHQVPANRDPQFLSCAGL